MNHYPPLTRTRDLRQQIGLLAIVESTDAAFLSCYLDLSRGKTDVRLFLERHAAALARDLSGAQRSDFEQALKLIRGRLEGAFHPQARGIAMFARGPAGGQFFSDLQFAVPLTSSLTCYPTPFIRPLMALKHRFDRFALVFVQKNSTEVAEIDLGAVSTRGWVANPKFRSVDDRWEAGVTDTVSATRSSARVRRQMRLITRLLQGAGRTPLFLAGDPELVSAMMDSLSEPLRARPVKLLPTTARGALEEAVDGASNAFSELRRRQSSQLACLVAGSDGDNGVSVSGGAPSLQALQQGRVDKLVLCEDYRLDSGWACSHCGESRLPAPVPEVCTACGRSEVQPFDLSAELVRLAAQQGVEVVIADSDELARQGGVGCLLQNPAEAMYLPPSAPSRRVQLVA